MMNRFKRCSNFVQTLFKLCSKFAFDFNMRHYIKGGEVALVDLHERRVEWATEGGHTETIFDCSLSRLGGDD